MNPRLRDAGIVLLAVAAIVGASAAADARWLHWLAKPAATLLIASIVWQVQPALSPRYRRGVLLGMALSCLGDIALMLPLDAFLPGLVAFLLAHLCYIAAFAGGARGGRALLASVLLLGAVAAVNVIGLWPHLPVPMRLPVLVYVGALALMAALALARAMQGHASPPGARWAAGGALLFVASDALLAWDRFAGGLPQASLLVLATYYVAQYGIARSVAGADQRNCRVSRK
ncbi:lysoplasmalogenase [Stenotrophomonas sp. 24(2023)]|uniref:lysoplasmalogenase n=1 Tax=Stenotrophomonas sp. 24(2023) TaxID=3068324 RepID=UPI0027DFABA3|nr:lysoplasmalogenase [Stenotrophomonas sp. 24(2023)]WMJ68327.1 lysoplasmalogenase [Stenotrophomonas sp. 24(2023)]